VREKMSEKKEEERLRKALERKWAVTFTVPEATAKPVMRMGAFQRFVMAWEGWEFDGSWNIVPSTSKKRIRGGLRFKLPGLEKIYVYKFRWRDIQLAKEGRDRVTPHEELIDYILLKPDYYALDDIEKAETLPPERIPLTLRVSVMLRVVNPYKALFIAPPNWFENVTKRLESILRDWVAQRKMDDVFKFRREPKTTWQEFKDNPLIQMFEKDWGIKVEENGIDIRDIDLPKEYQEAAALEKKMKMEATAKKTQFEIEAKARAAETVGTVIEMMAKARGKKVKEIQAEIETKPRLRKEFLKLANDLIVRKMGIEGAAYVDIRVEGPPRVGGKTEGQGFLSGLIDKFAEAMIKIEAAKQRMPRGGREERRETKERKEGIPRKTTITKEGIEEAKERFRKATRET